MEGVKDLSPEAVGVRVSMTEGLKRQLPEVVAVVVIGGAALLVFHRATLLSGFDLVQAGIGDSPSWWGSILPIWRWGQRVDTRVLQRRTDDASRQ